MRFLIIFILASMGLFACKKEKDNAVHGSSKSELVPFDSLATRQKAMLISEDLFWLIQQEPENHLDKAKQKYLSKEMKLAAAEIKKVSAYLEEEIYKAQDKRQLQAAQITLNELAKRLEKGEQVKESELLTAFMEANVALYKNFTKQYEQLYTDYASESKQISAYLDATLQKIENIDKWSTKKLDKQGQDIIKEGKTLSTQIKKDLKQNNGKAKQEWAKFKEKLRDLDRKLEGNSNGIL